MGRKPKRTSYQQLFSILEEARHPISKTVLSRRAAIIYDKFLVMCQFLEERGFLVKVECEKWEMMNGEHFRYHITLKGLDELRAERDGFESHAILRFDKWKQNNSL